AQKPPKQLHMPDRSKPTAKFASLPVARAVNWCSADWLSSLPRQLESRGDLLVLHRRDCMLRIGQAGLGALALPKLLRAESTAAGATGPRATAKSCILLYLWGGPPQQDMWDMKPHAPEGIRSQFQPIDTVVP